MGLDPVACSARHDELTHVPTADSLIVGRRLCDWLVVWQPSRQGETIMLQSALLLTVLLAALAAPARAQTEAVFDLGPFSFENGGSIPDMKVGYVT
jgi:hypothetical protein